MRLDGEKVLREREVRALNAHEGARLIGISANALLNAEHGDVIRPATAKKIAAGYGCTVADLLPTLGDENPKVRALGEKYRPFAEGLNAYCADYEGLLEAGTTTRQDVAGFVRVLQTVGAAMGKVYQDELKDIAVALGLASWAGERILSGVPEEKVGAEVDARLQEHSQMHEAIQRYFAVGRALAEAIGDEEAEEQVRRIGQALTGAAA